MNTLNRQTTAILFDDCPAGAASGYDALRARWSALIHAPAQELSCPLTATHHLLYLILLGRDWRTAFTLVSNADKVANGGLYNWGLYRALGILHSARQEAALLAPFVGIVTPKMLAQVRALLPPAPAILLAAQQNEGNPGFYSGDAYSEEVVVALVSVRKEGA